MFESINQLGRQWALYFGFVTLQNTLFLAVVLSALWLLRNAKARVKYFVTLVGLVKLLLPPVLPFPSANSFPPFSLFIEAIPISVNSEARITHDAGLLRDLDPYGALFLSWAALSLAGLIIPIFATLSLKAKLTSSKKIPAGTDATVAGQGIDVFETSKLAFPLSIGLFRSKIFMPTTYEKWPTECRTLIIHHELAHIQRRDAWMQVLQVVVRALYFFHPLVWLLSNRMEEYREMICDETAIADAQVSPVEYSRFLVYIAEQITRGNPGCAVTPALIRQKNQLLKRVAYHIKEENMRPIKKTIVVLVFVLLLALIMPLSWYCNKKEPSASVVGKPESNPMEQDSPSEHPQFILFDEEPKIVQRVELKYPEAAIASKVEGKVIAYLFINKKGTVDAVRILKIDLHQTKMVDNRPVQEPVDDTFGISEAVKEAAMNWKFIPAKIKSEPIGVWISIPFNFTLR